MRRTLNAYLDTVCSHVRYPDLHEEIRRELEGHVRDLADRLHEEGMDRHEALMEAVSRMGDPDSMGRELAKKHKPRTEWHLILITAALLAVGAWAMWALDASGAGGNLFSRQVWWYGFGLAAAAGLYFLDYRSLQDWWWLFFTDIGVLMIFLVPWGGEPDVSARAVLPLVLAVSLAAPMSRWDWEDSWAWLKAGLLFLLPTAALLYLVSYSAGLEYAVVFAVLFFRSRPRWRDIGAFAAVGMVGAAIATQALDPNRIARVKALLTPGSDYTTRLSTESLRAAGPWGQGATAPMTDLPAVHQDFVMTYLTYTLGWVAAAAIVGLAVLLLVRLLKVSQRVRDPYGRTLVVALVTVFLFHYGINLLMVTGVIFPVSTTVPFLSYGGEQMAYLAAVGLVLSVFRRKDLIPAYKGV